MKRALVLCLLFATLVASCGSEREVIQAAPAPAPAPPQTGPGPGTAEVSFAEVSSVMATYCARCHANARFISNEQAFKSSQAQSRTSSLNMPPPSSQEARGLSAADRQKIVSF